MRSLSLLSLLFLLACGKPKEQEKIPEFKIATNDPAWSVYEGVLPGDEGDVRVELSLQEGHVGMESFFEYRAEPAPYSLMLHLPGWDRSQTTIINSKARGGRFFLGMRGRYLTESINGEIYITLRETTTKVFNGKNEKLEEYTFPEMKFKTTDGNWLTLVEHGFPSDENKTYRIPKRQRMFTAEGFYSAVGDSTEFYETNTGQYWRLAKEGLYDNLLVEYRKKKREKFEGIYLRGLAYSVKELDEEGNEIESIVFKRLISLDKIPNEIASK